nr:uncharacterized protein LOC106731549 [Pelodiscus sinensis]|eukprot:XP_014425852.1 uncharacterized protein LOC106731549 [Pelodiscus sinensis]
MLSLFYGTDRERQRLVRVSQALHDSLQGCILATRTLLHLLSQHLDTSVGLESVGGDVPVGQSLEHLLWAAREIHAAAEQTDRHVQKNISRELYTRLASPYSSLQEKAAIVRDFHQATMGIFGSVGGPVVAVVLRKGADAPPGAPPAGPPQSSPVSGTGLVQTLQGYLPEAVTGCRARNAVMAATGHLEEARQALAPACKSFQLLAVEAEVYVGLIAEQQLGRAEGPGQIPAGLAH